MPFVARFALTAFSCSKGSGCHDRPRSMPGCFARNGIGASCASRVKRHLPAGVPHDVDVPCVQFVTNLRPCRAYVAELARVMPDQEAPPAGTPAHARLLELVASMRRLLAIFLAEHMTTMRELRKCVAVHSHSCPEPCPLLRMDLGHGCLCNHYVCLTCYTSDTWTQRDWFKGHSRQCQLHYAAEGNVQCGLCSLRVFALCRISCATGLCVVCSVNTEKVTPEAIADTNSDQPEVSTAPASVFGKRETVSWRKSADCVRLTAAQAAAVAEARTTVGARLTECALQHSGCPSPRTFSMLLALCLAVVC